MNEGDHTMKFKQKELRSMVNKAIRKQELSAEEREVLTVSNSGIELPTEVKTDLLESKRPYKSMKQFVHVIPVSKTRGNYTAEDESNIGELHELDPVNGIPTSDENIKGLNYEVKGRGSISPVGASTFNNAALDLVDMVRRSHGRKAVKTENKLIFATMQQGLTPESVTGGYDELSKLAIEDIDPALENETVIITNQDGLKELVGTLDANGNSLLKAISLSGNKPKYYLGVNPVECFSNKELPSIDNGDGTFSAPFFYGSFNQSIKFFEYDTMEISVATVAEFHRDLYLIKGIEKFDVQKHGQGDYQYKLLTLS